MPGSEHSPAFPGLGGLRESLLSYFKDTSSDATPLHEVLQATFCVYAAAGVPIERALRNVNVEIGLVSPSSYGPSDRRLRSLKTVVMACCLECYYPEPEPVAE